MEELGVGGASDTQVFSVWCYAAGPLHARLRDEQQLLLGLSGFAMDSLAALWTEFDREDMDQEELFKGQTF